MSSLTTAGEFIGVLLDFSNMMLFQKQDNHPTCSKHTLGVKHCKKNATGEGDCYLKSSVTWAEKDKQEVESARKVKCSEMKSQSLSAVRTRRPPQTGDIGREHRTRQAEVGRHIGPQIQEQRHREYSILFKHRWIGGKLNQEEIIQGLEKGFKNPYLNTEKEGDFLKNKNI